MPKSKKEAPIVLEPLDSCPSCRRKLIAMPPCPVCGSEIPSYMSIEQNDYIINFLKANKGSQCRIFLGKDQGKNDILIVELLKKSELGEEN